MKAVVVDTNVPMTANEADGDLACILACVEKLIEVLKNGVVSIDDHDLIMREYRRNLGLSRRPPIRTGDAFMIWMHDHEWDCERCERVAVTPKAHDPEDFEEIPADPHFAGFDRSDRKFLAVAIASRVRPTILNATDSDWWHYRVALAKHGIEVNNLCPGISARSRASHPK